MDADADADFADRLIALESSLAHLERHLTEQDRVVLDQGRQIAALGREMERLREALAKAEGQGQTSDDEGGERPPHY